MAQNLIGGRWLLPIAGVATIIGMGITFYWAVTMPAIGPSTVQSTMLLVAIFGLGFVIYVARYFKAKGLDLIHVQKMIPPD